MSIEGLPHDGVEREVLVKKDKIAERVEELGVQISKDYKDKNPILVGVLKGSFIFLGDLMRKLDPDLKAEVDFMEISSYGSGKESSRQPKFNKDLSTNIEGRHVIVVEDIVDTGYSFDSLLKILKARNPASLKTCALVSKPDRREVEVPIDYLGFTIDDVWIEGNGMDTDQKYRGLIGYCLSKNLRTSLGLLLFLHAIIAPMHEIFRKNNPEKKQEQPPKTWKYEYFKEYLLALGRGPNFIESIQNFPKEIELSNTWHKTFNQLRSETQDGFERHIFIAIDPNSSSILLPIKPVVGTESHVSAKKIFQQIAWGMDKNIEDFIGSMHSHPVGNDFSAGDLFELVYHHHEQIMCLAGADQNLIAFGTRETNKTDLDYLKLDKSQLDFMAYWYNSNGYKRNGNYIWKTDNSRANYDDLRKIEMMIAEKHKLAIYLGEPNQSVKRIHPPV